MINAVTAACSYSCKSQTVEINMDIQPATIITTRLKACIRIFNCNKAADAAVVYQHPADASKFQLSCKETLRANSIIMNNSYDGKIEIKYDADTNTINGIINGFRFTPAANTVQSLLLNCKFNHAAIRN